MPEPTARIYQLLARRREVFGPCHSDPHAYRVRCPAEHEHHSGCAGDGSTVVFVADSRGQPLIDGILHCFHSACVGRTRAEWHALLGLRSLERRTAKIVATFDNYTRDGRPRVTLRVVAVDGGPPIKDYVRVAPNNGAWAALWAAAKIAPPTDLLYDGDLGGAVDALVGRTISLELDTAPGAMYSVRRILEPEP